LPTPSNKSLDASGGSAFRNWPDAAEGALIRAAASTQTFDGGSDDRNLCQKTLDTRTITYSRID
jgi:hypothetical protein